jgi:predicted nucleotidyltransferase
MPSQKERRGRLMSMDDLKFLSLKFAREVVEKVGDVLAFWISGSLARGDFIRDASDVDLEMIVKKRPREVVTTDDIKELREITACFRRKAMEKGATGFHCFVKEIDDYQESLQSLDLALHAKTVFGKEPSEFFDLHRMKREIRKLAMKTISDYSKMGKLVLENRQPYEVEGLEDSVRLVM